MKVEQYKSSGIYKQVDLDNCNKKYVQGTIIESYSALYILVVVDNSYFRLIDLCKGEITTHKDFQAYVPLSKSHDDSDRKKSITGKELKSLLSQDKECTIF